MTNECWKTIEDCPQYEISSCGKVRNIAKPTELLSAWNHHGYLAIRLRKDKKPTKKLFVHRLVAQAFIPNLTNGIQVNHKNNIRKDNRAENLEWVCPNENMVKMWIHQNTTEMLIEHLKSLGYEITKPEENLPASSPKIRHKPL
jgi:hypothetical protein